MSKIEERHLSGIVVDWLVVRELRFQDNVSLRGADEWHDLGASISINGDVDEERRTCRCTMKLSFSPSEQRPDAFQSLSATVEAQFSVAAGTDPTVNLDEFSEKQAPAILMPFLREAIASATAKSRFGQLLVPPINVAALVTEMQKVKKANP